MNAACKTCLITTFQFKYPKDGGNRNTLINILLPKMAPIYSMSSFNNDRSIVPSGTPKRHSKKGMLPSETAGIIIDEIASDRNVTNFEVLENAPAVIDQHEGFKILFTYKDKKGAIFKTLYYGFISGDSFYNLRYNAVIKDYFEKDIVDFKQILNSFKLVRG